MTHDAIAVIDFGGQYAHLIATKIRRLHVLAEIRQPEDPTDAFRRYKGIIISGSPALASFGEDSAYNKAIYDLDVPIFGFCFGHQEIAKHYGGTVVHGGREWGPADMQVVADSPIFKGLGRTERVWMSHFDSVTSVGPGFEELGYTTLGSSGAPHRYAAIGSNALRRWGVQFHPEVDDTVHGDEMIANFVLGVCGCTPSWTMERYVEERIEQVRRQVGDQSVFLLASGGVDSTVAARLLGMAIGADRLHLLHVDNGLMRKDESRDVLDMFRAFGLDRNLHFVDASEAFLSALAGVVEPEQKRTIIGNTFIEVFEGEAKRLGIEGHLLGQGTIYPDTIETGGTRRADTIKTHHNRVPVIEDLIEQGRVVEPLADLYKVEVRELGEKLGIPHDLVWRHPFPGPGLGVRLLCSAGEAPGDGPGRDRAEGGRGRRALRRGGAGPADQVGRREGRPAVVRAPGDRERRRAVGDAARNGREPLPGRPGHQPLHLEPGAGRADAVRPARRHGDARAARPAPRSRPSRDGRPAPPRHLRRDLAVPDGAGAPRSRRARARVRHRPADSLGARDDGDAGAAARGARRRTARADPGAAGRERPGARRHHQAAGDDRMGVGTRGKGLGARR